MSMKIGMGLLGFSYYQADGKTTNLLDPLVIGHPVIKDPSIKTDVYGWPTYIPPGGSVGWYLPATQGYTRPGRYRITASGSGRLLLMHQDLPPSMQSITVKSDGHQSQILAEWDVTTTVSTTFMAIFETDPNDHLRDIRIYRTTDNPYQMFTQEYINELKNFSVLRTAGYNQVVASPDVNWPSFQGAPNGIPARYMAAIGICNKTSRDLWLCVPHMATPDYVRSLAKMVKTYLRPGLNVWLEYSDEIWNWGGPFYVATKWVEDWGHANISPTIPYQMSAAELAHRNHEIFASEGVPIVRLFCDQFTYTWLFTAQAYPYARDRKYHFDAVGVAPYVDAEGIDWGVLDPLILSGKEEDRQAAMDHVFAAYHKGMGAIERYSKEWKGIADERGLRLVCYEMGPGWSIDWHHPAHRLAFYRSTHYDPRMKTFLMNEYFPCLDQYYELGMYTQDCNMMGDGKFWGAKANADDNDCPKWQACMEWSASHNA